MTLPRPERALPKRRPKPASFSSPRRAAASGALPQVRPASKKIAAPTRNEPKRIPVGEVALLDGEQRPRGAVLVAQRVAAQAVVTAEQDLVVEIEPPALGADERA